MTGSKDKDQLNVSYDKNGYKVNFNGLDTTKCWNKDGEYSHMNRVAKDIMHHKQSAIRYKKQDGKLVNRHYTPW